MSLLHPHRIRKGDKVLTMIHNTMTEVTITGVYHDTCFFSTGRYKEHQLTDFCFTNQKEALEYLNNTWLCGIRMNLKRHIRQTKKAIYNYQEHPNYLGRQEVMLHLHDQKGFYRNIDRLRDCYFTSLKNINKYNNDGWMIKTIKSLYSAWGKLLKNN